MGLAELLHRRCWAPLAARWRHRQIMAAALPAAARPHGLPGTLAVSLTSYPPRFPHLAATLRSILLQEVRPDAIELWIAHGDLAALPAEVTALAAHGVAVRPCDDLRCYKKLIPALRADPARTVITLDDDTWYPPDVVGTLVEGARRHPGCVVCLRAHRITVGADGLPRPYAEWTWNVPACGPAADLLPTGMGGVLYPPGVFDPRVLDQALFTRLSPAADDLWLYAMARLRGTRVVKAGPPRRFLEWGGGGGPALWRANVQGGGNDRQLAALVEAFGPFYR